jgi:N,N'-diacetyllegionaminate synthase|tara:strand:- start:237 stop:1280 length:1044 start_codon:yes stop_codon:yes gene_type:complete
MNCKRPIFIIAEAGSNWRMGDSKRDMKMAKTLIDVGSDAGADAIKFQTYRSESVYVPNAGDSDYLSKSGIKESINKIFDDLSMPYEMIPELYEYCNSKNIEFMSTPFSVEDAKQIDPYVNYHKIASYEISHYRLIEFIAKTNKPTFLSTGGATIDEIEWAVNHFYKNGGINITLLQTTAKYPAPLESLNIYSMDILKNRFNVSVGLSDHSIDPVIGPVCATALGASVIEKHFTLNKKLPGPDHSFALDPNELKKMVKAIRNCEKCLGLKEKIVQNDEIELRDFAQRSIQCIKNILKDEIFLEGVNFEILRSGKCKKGMHPKFLESLEGKKSTRSISIGDGILESDYE